MWAFIGQKWGKPGCNSIWVTEPRAAKLQPLPIPFFFFLGNQHLRHYTTSTGALGSFLLPVTLDSSGSRRESAIEGVEPLSHGPFRPPNPRTCSSSRWPWHGTHSPFLPTPLLHVPRPLNITRFNETDLSANASGPLCDCQTDISLFQLLSYLLRV